MSVNTQNIQKSFMVEPSQESAEIAEAFGIEAGHEKEILDINLPEELPQITYITGESGCGKTTLIKELGWEEPDLDIPETPLYQWADDTDEALRNLSQVGLGDATLFVSPYSDISDSQQYRAELYYRLINTEGVIFLDEFLSTLDRGTAKPVAYVFQKVCRRLNRPVVVAEPHDDLAQYLQPDLEVRGKAFPSRWTVLNHEDDDIQNPFWDDYSITNEDKYWYRDCSLAELHYKGKHTGGTKEYRACHYDGQLVGLLVSTYRMWDGGRRISRLVTHPSYRGCGVGQYLVESYLDEFPGADTVAAMARFNPVFEKAGMERVEDSTQRPPSGLTTDLKNEGFDKEQWFSKEYCKDFMQEPSHRELFTEYSDDVTYFVSPGGDYLEDEEVEAKIREESETAGRVLWNVRPKRMAKFVGPEFDSD